MRVCLIVTGLWGASLILGGVGRGEDGKPEAAKPGTRVVRVATLGDSITKGVREGVRSEETFAAIAERTLKADGIAVEILNLGIGGERTDQALNRLDAVTQQRPEVVTVMYGTNDSYVDRGATASRISREEYKANLKAIISRLRLCHIKPILMTEPRWADDAPVNGLGEDPNVRLAPYMEACREVAAECRVPLVDHFNRWTKARSKGQALRDWTTDGCHPNPRGHRELAEGLLPFLRASFQPAPRPVSFATRHEIMLTDGNGQFLRFHALATAVPKGGARF